MPTSVLADLRFALRHFSRRPLSVTTIVLVLGLGIGVHAAVFSLVQSVTTRPAPGITAHRNLVRVRGMERTGAGAPWSSRGFSYPEYRELAAERDVFGTMAGWTLESVAFAVGNSGKQTGPAMDDPGVAAARAQFVTGSYFATLGVRPVLGTILPSTVRADESEPELVAVIGHAFWQGVFGGAPDVLGKLLQVNGIAVRIVGVAPPQFNGATPTAGDRMLWLPLSARTLLLHTNAESLRSRDSSLLQAVALLAPGRDARAATNTSRLTLGFAGPSGINNASGAMVTNDVDVVALRGNTDLPANGDATMYAVVYGSVAFLILLVACTNVSALVVGAGVMRRQEIAIRLSLGASRSRIVRQLLTESTLLASMGAIIGLTLYWAVVTGIAARFPDLDLAPDIGTVAFTMCLALGTGILFGLSPALHATRSGVSHVLKDSGGGATSRSRLQRVFVVAQIALTQPLLVGLGMLLATLSRDQSARISESVSSHVVLLRMSSDYPQLAAGRLSLSQVISDIGSAPGMNGVVVEPSGLMNVDYVPQPEETAGPTPGVVAGMASGVHVEGTGPGYFSMIGVPIIQGRDISRDDSAARDLPVVIGSDLARQLWAGSNPIGRRIVQQSRGRALTQQAVVVGVYDARFPTTRGAGTRVYTFRSLQQAHGFLVRTSLASSAAIASIRSQLRRQVPYMPINRLQSLTQYVDENSDAAFRVSAGAAAGGLLALLMASIGLYGVVSLAVGQRRREIGIRMALGARPGKVVAMLFNNGLQLGALGIVLGLPLSVFALRILAGMARLPEFSLPLLGAAIAGVVLLVASLATWFPARRAATIDPVAALRSEH